MECTSPNQDFHLRVSKGIIDKTGEKPERVGNGVTLQRDDVVQFEKDLRAPTLGAVANDGTSVAIEGKNWDKSSEEREGNERFTTIYVYDQSGTLLFEQNLDAKSVKACAIDGAGSRMAVGGINGNEVAIYDVATGDKVITKGYDAIESPSEITTVANDDTWLFNITDIVGGDPTSIHITTTGEIVSGPEDKTETDNSQTENADADEAVEALLRDRGHPVPKEVYGLVFTTSEHANVQGVDEQLRTLVERGPIYEPPWSDYTYIIPDTPTVLYVVGVKSTADAAVAFNRLCDMEQIDLSNWYQVQSTSSTVSPTPGDFEQAVRSVSRTEEAGSVTTEGGGISVDEETLLNGIIRQDFYIDPETTNPESDLGAPKNALPENNFGDQLRAAFRDGMRSESEYKQLATEVESDQIVAAFPTLLDLLATGEVFTPYSIDLRYRKPSVQPLFNEIARESPDTVLRDLDQLETHLGNRSSITAPEVACRALQTLVEVHPSHFEELVPMLKRLWESKSAHPRRRVLEIVSTALKQGDPDVAEILDIEPDTHVSYLVARMDATESAWLRYACCTMILATDLNEADYDQLESEAETLVQTFRCDWGESSRLGKDQRIASGRRGLNSPAYGSLMDDGPLTDDELLNRIRSPSSSAVALYRLYKYGAGPVLQDFAVERPDAILAYLDTLMETFTATADQMEQMRKVSKQIVRTAIENLPEKQYKELVQYDETVLPLLESADRHDVVFALEWARRSASEAAIDALAAIHADPTHDRWQQATAILKDIAPDRVDADREPDNARTRWAAYVSELAAEQGKLPASGDVHERSDTPEPPHWEVFDGWQAVLDTLDIETTYRTSNSPLRGRLIEDLQRVAEHVDGIPTTGNIDEYSKYTYTNFKNEFGGIRQAREAAGVAKDHQ